MKCLQNKICYFWYYLATKCKLATFINFSHLCVIVSWKSNFPLFFALELEFLYCWQSCQMLEEEEDRVNYVAELNKKQNHFFCTQKQNFCIRSTSLFNYCFGFCVALFVLKSSGNADFSCWMPTIALQPATPQHTRELWRKINGGDSK